MKIRRKGSLGQCDVRTRYVKGICRNDAVSFNPKGASEKERWEKGWVLAGFILKQVGRRRSADNSWTHPNVTWFLVWRWYVTLHFSWLADRLSISKRSVHVTLNKSCILYHAERQPSTRALLQCRSYQTELLIELTRQATRWQSGDLHTPLLCISRASSQWTSSHRSSTLIRRSSILHRVWRWHLNRRNLGLQRLTTLPPPPPPPPQNRRYAE